MIFDADMPIIKAAEELARGGAATTQVLKVLRTLSLLDFGMLHLELPNQEFPNLSRLLPRMAHVEIQTGWTGHSGYDLFRQTKDFCLRLENYFLNYCNRGLRDAFLLDYGCGWGRLARMMTYYTDPAKLYLIDPWQASIDVCREYGILGNLAVSSYLPSTLPVGDAQFDLIYAYSVFTHTSKRATITALNTLRRYIKPDGLLVITVRPIEVWDLPDLGEPDQIDRDALRAEFRNEGFAFAPSLAYETDGDHTFGTTSIAPGWLQRNLPDWIVVAGDRGEDHLQYILVLKPSVTLSLDTRPVNQIFGGAMEARGAGLPPAGAGVIEAKSG